jgi:hypothetical protein
VIISHDSFLKNMFIIIKIQNGYRLKILTICRMTIKITNNKEIRNVRLMIEDGAPAMSKKMGIKGSAAIRNNIFRGIP